METNLIFKPIPCKGERHSGLKDGIQKKVFSPVCAWAKIPAALYVIFLLAASYPQTGCHAKKYDHSYR